MKFKADRATLLKALAHISRASPKSANTIPILANAKIEALDGKLMFTATDMEIAVVEDVAASVSQPGSTTAPAATLYEIVRKLPDECRTRIRSDRRDRPTQAARRPLRDQPGDATSRRFSEHDRRPAPLSVYHVEPGRSVV